MAKSSIFLRPQVTRFTILFVERSGSTYLTSLLDAHPDILASREEFAVLRHRGQSGADQLAWARQFYTPPLIGKHKAYGFKTKILDILDRDGFAQLMTDYHCHVIQLQRRNAIKAAISTINAKRLYDVTGKWNRYEASDRMLPFSVDFDEFERLLQERRDWDRDIEEYVGRLQLPKLSLWYEDLLLDESAFLHRIFDFIGVRNLPVKGKTLKNTKDDLREAILNFDELRSRYNGTDYELMFDEVLV